MRSFRSEGGGASLKILAQIASNSALFMAGRPAIWSESAVFMGLLGPSSPHREKAHTHSDALLGRTVKSNCEAFRGRRPLETFRRLRWRTTGYFRVSLD